MSLHPDLRPAPALEFRAHPVSVAKRVLAALLAAWLGEVMAKYAPVGNQLTPNLVLGAWALAGVCLLDAISLANRKIEIRDGRMVIPGVFWTHRIALERILSIRPIRIEGRVMLLEIEARGLGRKLRLPPLYHHGTRLDRALPRLRRGRLR